MGVPENAPITRALLTPPFAPTTTSMSAWPGTLNFPKQAITSGRMRVIARDMSSFESRAASLLVLAGDVLSSLSWSRQPASRPGVSANPVDGGLEIRISPVQRLKTRSPSRVIA